MCHWAEEGDPSGNLCSDDTLIKIPMEPENQLRMDCTLARSEYRHPSDSNAASPTIPIGPGAGAEVRWLGSGAESGTESKFRRSDKIGKQPWCRFADWNLLTI
jgi:hypothetical protein